MKVMMGMDSGSPNRRKLQVSMENMKRVSREREQYVRHLLCIRLTLAEIISARYESMNTVRDDL